MTQTRISLENIDDETFDKIKPRRKFLNEWEQQQQQQHRQNRRFSQNRFQQLGILKILSNGWCW